MDSKVASLKIALNVNAFYPAVYVTIQFQVEALHTLARIPNTRLFDAREISECQDDSKAFYCAQS